MTSETVAPAEAAEIIRRAAGLVDEHGWLMMHGATAQQMGVPGIGLTTAVCWAVHGQPCEGRVLTDRESEMVADLLECLEVMLGTSVGLYERRHAGATPGFVSTELRSIAWILGTPPEDAEDAK